MACFDGLTFGDYTVHETVPAGYHGEADKTVTVDNLAFCSDDPYVGETVSLLQHTADRHHGLGELAD